MKSCGWVLAVDDELRLDELLLNMENYCCSGFGYSVDRWSYSSCFLRRGSDTPLVSVPRKKNLSDRSNCSMVGQRYLAPVGAGPSSRSVHELDREEVLERSIATPVLASCPARRVDNFVLEAVVLPVSQREALLPETVVRVAPMTSRKRRTLPGGSHSRRRCAICGAGSVNTGAPTRTIPGQAAVVAIAKTVVISTTVPIIHIAYQLP